MKAIKNYSVQSILCFLLLIMLCRVSAQQYMPLLSLAEKSQSLEAVKMSSNGKYITSRLIYDLNRDTLLIFNTSVKDRPAGVRTKIGEHYFIGAHTLLLPSGSTAELWNLQTGRQTFFKDIVKAQALTGNMGFIIHYGPQQDNKLLVYDQNGLPKQELKNVKSFFLLADGSTAAVTSGDEKEPSQLFILSASDKKKVYSSGLLIEHVEMGYRSSEILIFEKNTADKYQNLKYLDLISGELFVFKDILPVNFNAAYLEKNKDQKGYFIRLWSEGKVDDGIVDVWYGSDRDLLQKYYSRGSESAYLWQPREKKVQDLNRQDLPNTVSLGNGRYYLGIDPSLLNDYTFFNPDIEVNLLDSFTGSWKVLGRLSPEIYVSANGEYLLSPKDKKWFLYDLKQNKSFSIGGAELIKPFFTEDGSSVLFEGEGGIWQYNITSGRLSKLINAPGFSAKIINGNVNRMSYSGIAKNTVSLQAPLLIQLSDPDKMIMKYIRWYNGKETVITELSADLYTESAYDNQVNYVCYVEQNYNMPPRLIYTEAGKNKQALFQTNSHDKKAADFRQEIITYTDGQGNPCRGILFYPAGYNESGTYPMVVQIYEKQGMVKNQYLNLSFHNTEGFNARILLENGYFVFYPDIQYGSLGPGIAALQCVTNAIDALKLKKQIDQKKIGLTGHSFGGYEVNFIATQSCRFAAYLSGTGSSDLISGYHSFNLNYSMPLFSRYETFQFRMHKPFSEDKQIYFNNNPIYNAEKVNAPMLLWTGMLDENIKWEETRSFYNALLRNKKPVIALFYRNEGHSLLNMDANLDLSIRTLDWFNYFLKDDHSITWIEQEIKKGAD